MKQQCVVVEQNGEEFVYKITKRNNLKRYFHTIIEYHWNFGSFRVKIQSKEIEL